MRGLTAIQRYEAKVDRLTTPEGCHPWVAGRRSGGYLRGAQNGFARLSEDQVKLARRLHAEGTATRVLARTFGISQTQMRRVIAREVWSHV